MENKNSKKRKMDVNLKLTKMVISKSKESTIDTDKNINFVDPVACLRDVYPQAISKDRFLELCSQRQSTSNVPRPRLRRVIDRENDSQGSFDVTSLGIQDHVLWIHDHAMYFPSWIITQPPAFESKDLLKECKSFVSTSSNWVMEMCE